jgi:hypothetical protein
MTDPIDITDEPDPIPEGEDEGDAPVIEPTDPEDYPSVASEPVTEGDPT